MSTIKRLFDILKVSARLIDRFLALSQRRGIRGFDSTLNPVFPSHFLLGKVEKMSETNPAPTTTPPVEPPVPVPTPAPTPEPAPSTAAPSATPDIGGLVQRLETVLQGLPERTANAVREVSPQHVPNPTAAPQQQQQQQTPPPPGDNPSGKTSGGPSRLAKWFHGIQ